MASCDTTVAVGAIIAEVPCVDLLDLSELATGQRVVIEGEDVWTE
jgi:predicted aconitase with swiveling domain